MIAAYLVAGRPWRMAQTPVTEGIFAGQADLLVPFNGQWVGGVTMFISYLENRERYVPR